MSRNCKHTNKRLVWATENAYGQTYQRPQVREQCLDCGWLLGEQKSRSLANADTPNADMGAAKRCIEERNRAWLRQAQERDRIYQEQRERENAAWRARYNEHLASEKWWRMRELIFERDGYTCRGCLSRSATQVHHTTYKHIGEEFAFELISICDVCHKRYHDK
jgi:5-methylcytosine-specific restriction endonuclease McrA